MVWATLTYSAMHKQEGMIQLFTAVKCPKMDILLQLMHPFLTVKCKNMLQTVTQLCKYFHVILIAIHPTSTC